MHCHRVYSYTHALGTKLCTNIPSTGCRDTHSCYLIDEDLSGLCTFLSYGVICQINKSGNIIFLKRAYTKNFALHYQNISYSSSTCLALREIRNLQKGILIYSLLWAILGCRSIALYTKMLMTCFAACNNSRVPESRCGWEFGQFGNLKST